MKYYVYAGYYENIISAHKLNRPYVLRDVFNSFEDAQTYLEENFEDDTILYTKDVEDDAYDYYGYLENGELDDFII